MSLLIGVGNSNMLQIGKSFNEHHQFSGSITTTDTAASNLKYHDSNGELLTMHSNHTTGSPPNIHIDDDMDIQVKTHYLLSPTLIDFVRTELVHSSHPSSYCPICFPILHLCIKFFSYTIFCWIFRAEIKFWVKILLKVKEENSRNAMIWC